jgi:hypothetical protein
MYGVGLETIILLINLPIEMRCGFGQTLYEVNVYVISPNLYY